MLCNDPMATLEGAAALCRYVAGEFGVVFRKYPHLGGPERRTQNKLRARDFVGSDLVGSQGWGHRVMASPPCPIRSVTESLPDNPPRSAIIDLPWFWAVGSLTEMAGFRFFFVRPRSFFRIWTMS